MLFSDKTEVRWRQPSQTSALLCGFKKTKSHPCFQARRLSSENDALRAAAERLASALRDAKSLVGARRRQFAQEAASRRVPGIPSSGAEKGADVSEGLGAVEDVLGALCQVS